MSLDLTVAMPLLSRLIYSEEEYFLRKELIQKEMTIFLNRMGNSDFKDIAVHYNTLDQKGRGLGGGGKKPCESRREDIQSARP